MTFYTYNQNNSGGSFVVDEAAGISHYVIVEANSETEADARAEGIGLYWDGVDAGYDCECCGDRWYNGHYSDGDEVPSIYGTPVTPAWVEGVNGHWKWIDGPEAYVHYLDGRVEPALA